MWDGWDEIIIYQPSHFIILNISYLIFSGMIILGGGLVKHHTCNANLMRNGADFSGLIWFGLIWSLKFRYFIYLFVIFILSFFSFCKHWTSYLKKIKKEKERYLIIWFDLFIKIGVWWIWFWSQTWWSHLMGKNKSNFRS